MKLPRPVARRIEQFLVGPASIRNAIAVLVAATAVTTVVGAALVWIFDRERFANPGDALWWSLQTVTTVGYGDVTPSNGLGRLIGAVVLLYAVAFMSILTAAITTTFVERARRARRAAEEPTDRTVVDRLDRISSRLAAIEARLERSTPTSAATGGDPAGDT